MKPQTKKSLKKERLEKEEMRRKELENLNKNLIKKLYADLFQMNADLYHEYDFTFETFLYDYYKEIENNLDFDNPNYEQLLKKLDLKIKAKFNEENKLSYDLNGRQLKYELNKLNDSLSNTNTNQNNNNNNNNNNYNNNNTNNNNNNNINLYDKNINQTLSNRNIK